MKKLALLTFIALPLMAQTKAVRPSAPTPAPAQTIEVSPKESISTQKLKTIAEKRDKLQAEQNLLLNVVNQKIGELKQQMMDNNKNEESAVAAVKAENGYGADTNYVAGGTAPDGTVTPGKWVQIKK